MRCAGLTRAGKRCRNAVHLNGYCVHHQGQAPRQAPGAPALRVVDNSTAYLRFPADESHPRPPVVGDFFTFGFGDMGEVQFRATRVLLQGVEFPEYVVFLKRERKP